MLAHHAVAVGIDGGDQLLDLISGELYAYVPHHRSDLLGINVPVAVHICAATQSERAFICSVKESGILRTLAAAAAAAAPQPQLQPRRSAAAASQPQPRLRSRCSAADAPQQQLRSSNSLAAVAAAAVLRTVLQQQPRCSSRLLQPPPPRCSRHAAAATLQPPRCSSHHAVAAPARMLRPSRSARARSAGANPSPRSHSERRLHQ